MRTPESLRLAALVGLAAAGCSSAVNPDKIKPTASAICGEGYAALLDKSAQCFVSPPAWIRATSPAPDCAAWDRAVAAGRLHVDPGQLTQCLSDIAAIDCLTLFATAASGLPGACAQLVTGQVQEAGSCYLSDECASGTYCDLGATCPGTCTAYGGPGAACGATGDPYCRTDLACIDAGTSTCQSYLGTGADCSSNRFACAPGLVCDTSSAAPTLKCVTAAVGVPCSGPEWCPVPGLVCAGYTAATAGTCQATKGVGAGCLIGNRECAYGAYCAGTTVGTPGTCVAYPSTLNASYACGVVLNELVDCIGGYCAAGSCVSYIPTAQACDIAYLPAPDVQCGRWSKGYYCDPATPNVCKYYRCTEP